MPSWSANLKSWSRRWRSISRRKGAPGNEFSMTRSHGRPNNSPSRNPQDSPQGHRGQTEKEKINMKPQNLIHMLIGIVCIGLLTAAKAVVPPPDGGYPGGNTAEGQNALLSLTTGGFNTAVGFLSLRSITSNQFNTAIGAGTLLANTADQHCHRSRSAFKQHNWC